MAGLDHPRDTARLHLRAFDAGDLDALAVHLADASVNRYLYTDPRTREEVEALLEGRLARALDPQEPFINIAVTERESGDLVGDFILRWDPVHRQGEIGGSLVPRVHGRGYATEVYRALIEIAFTTLDLHRVYAQCDARNAASIRSLEKAGLVREALLVENEFVKGEWTSEVIMALLAERWRRPE